MLPTPVLTLNVFNMGETGLLGVALDPNFATNGYIYVSYTVALTARRGRNQPYARLSRFTVVNGVASTASEKIYYTATRSRTRTAPGATTTTRQRREDRARTASCGGAWATTSPPSATARPSSNIYGKILRFNLDGSVPSDNPFIDVAGAVPYIYAYGLRNPWRFTFLPNGKAMTEDTGSELLGGPRRRPGRRATSAGRSRRATAGAAATPTPPTPTATIRPTPPPRPLLPTPAPTFPEAYDNVVFFGDYVRQDIEAVTFDPTYQTEVSDAVFDSNAGTIADLEEGPDGNLYLASIFGGTVSEISATGPVPPDGLATAVPAAGAAPLTTQFSSAASSDPYGKPLTDSWNFGDGSPVSTTANPSHTYTTAGTYTATLTVNNGSQSSSATTTAPPGTSPPTAVDHRSGHLQRRPDGLFQRHRHRPAPTGCCRPATTPGRWTSTANGVLQPSYFAEVADPFYGPLTGATDGSVTIPTDPSQVPGSYYRITLTVTDSQGPPDRGDQGHHSQPHHLVGNDQRRRRRVLGRRFLADRAYSTQDVVGVVHVLTGMPLAQTVGGVRYRFVGWADGSALTDTITAGSGPGTYTADYEAGPNTVPSPVAEHRHRRTHHRRHGRLLRPEPELLPGRFGRRRLRGQRPVPLRVPDPQRRRHHRGPGPLPDQLQFLGQGRRHDQAVGHVRRALRGRPGGPRREPQHPQRQRGGL